MSKDIVKLIGMSKEYDNSDTGPAFLALADINLTIAESEFVCLIGPSGCGKSTLLNLIAGFIRPTRGKIFIEDRIVKAPGPDRAVVFQDPWLFPWLTVIENVEFGLATQGIPGRERKVRSLEQLRLVGLEGYEKARPHMLSGGQRQRVALARVLALSPKVLLMDEPFSALDANTRERLQDELLRLCQIGHKTVLFVTHQVEEAVYLADRVKVMGPPPLGFCAEYHLDSPRPRTRTSDGQRRIADLIRKQLDNLPCCVPVTGGANKKPERRAKP